MNVTVDTIEVGPYHIMVNGRSIGTAATRRAAQRRADGRVGASIQGRRIPVARFGA